MSQVSATKRESVLKRDGHYCQFCGMGNDEHNAEYGRSLHVHHIVPQRSDGSDDTENLITVCRSCHNTLEHTQANAIEQLEEEYTPDVDVESLRKDIDRLEEVAAGYEKAIEYIATRKITTTAYLTYAGALSADVLYVGDDKETAYERFGESDCLAHMEETKLRFDSWDVDISDVWLDYEVPDEVASVISGVLNDG